MLKAKLLTLCASTLFMGAKAQTPKLGVDPIEKVINAMTLDEKLNVLIGSGRCEQNVNSVVLHLVAHGCANLSYEFGVPSGTHHGFYWKMGAIESLRATFALGLDAQACRTVGNYCRRNA